MENLAKILKSETAAATDHAISDELRDVILEREAYAEKNTDCWISREQAMSELRKV